MKIALTHTRNALMDWDITVNVTAGTGEKIAFVEVRINDFADVDETQSDPVDSWEKQLTQKGVYPGDNKVEVRVTDQNGDDTRAKQEWTGY
jgi:hypothetical protein